MTSPNELPLISIVVGSVRPVRIGHQITDAVAPTIADAVGARVRIVDLAELNLPMLDEPKMPALGDYVHEHTKAWSRIVTESNAVVFVTPEYNAGYPAALKNAIDYLFHEWKGKPALIVSYGRHGGGASGAQLRQVLGFIGLDLVTDNVEITVAREGYGVDGKLMNTGAVVAVQKEALRVAGSALAEKLLAH